MSKILNLLQDFQPSRFRRFLVKHGWTGWTGWRQRLGFRFFILYILSIHVSISRFW